MTKSNRGFKVVIGIFALLIALRVLVRILVDLFPFIAICGIAYLIYRIFRPGNGTSAKGRAVPKSTNEFITFYKERLMFPYHCNVITSNNIPFTDKKYNACPIIITAHKILCVELVLLEGQIICRDETWTVQNKGRKLSVTSPVFSAVENAEILKKYMEENGACAEVEWVFYFASKNACVKEYFPHDIAFFTQFGSNRHNKSLALYVSELNKTSNLNH